MKMKLVTLMTLAGLLALHSACYALDVIKLKAPVLDHGTNGHARHEGPEDHA